MKTKSVYMRALACAFTFALVMAFSATVVMAAESDTLNDLNVALQELGLSVDTTVLPQRHDITSMAQDSIPHMGPHIGRLSTDVPIRITSEADVDVLLAFAQMATEQQLFGFSWDVCVDIALANAGLDDYWATGFRQITQAAREQSIVDLAMNYSVEELEKMGLLDRYGLLEELQSLGYFRYEVGDRINYTLRYELNAGFPNVRFAAGVARRGQQGVMNFSEHVVLLYPQTSSRTINVTFTRGGDVFGIQPGGGNSAVNYYQ